jgi:hypothetical protein
MCIRSEVLVRGRCFLLVLSLAIPSVFGGCGKSDHAADQEALQKIARTLDELKTLAKQQETAIRELGVKKPASAPESHEVEKKVAGLEGVVEDESKWPKSVDDAKRVRDDLQALLKQVPPSLDDALAPRIIPLRWNVEALGLLAATQKPQDEEWDSISANCRSFLQAAPDNRNQVLFDRLKERSKHAMTKAANCRRAAAIKAAKDALADNKRDPALAWTDLEAYESGEQSKDVTDLRNQLRVKLLERKTENQLKVLRATFDRAKAGGNDRRAQGAIARVYDAATSIFLDLDIESPRPEAVIKSVLGFLESCDNELKAINGRQQAEADGKVRAYQAWALKQIKTYTIEPGWQYKAVYDRVRLDLNSFKKAGADLDWEILKENPGVKDIIQEKTGVDISQVTGSVLSAEKQQEIYETAANVTGWKGSIDSVIAYRVSRDAMVMYLLPINPALLDTPVAQLYNKTFNEGWEKIGDHPEDLLIVAEQAATVKKRGIE